MIESLEVSVLPFSVHEDQICSIHKLKMKLYKPKHYPKHGKISLDDWEEILEVVYLRELEDAIQNNMLLLSKISGIKNFVGSSKSSNETDDVSNSGTENVRRKDNDDMDDDDGEDAEDLGLDVQKRKQQTTDERDYDDNSEDEQNEGRASSAGFGSEIEQAEDETEIEEAENGTEISKEENLENVDKTSTPKSSKKKSKREAKKKKNRAKLVRKEFDRAIYVEAKGFDFEVHFKFVNEPHILLAQVIYISHFILYFIMAVGCIFLWRTNYMLQSTRSVWECF